MSAPNINDPAGVAALLQSLRSSQAWASLHDNDVNPPTQSQPPSSSTSSAAADVKIITPAPAVAPTQVPPSGSSSVADLLAQLKNPIPDGAQTIPLHASSIESLDAPQRTSSAPSLDLDKADIFLRETLPPRKQRKDLRTLSLQQSLPILAELSERRDCVDCIVKLRKDQDELEKELWEERERILSAQQDKVKAAVTKANIIGSEISDREAKAMSQSFEKELDKFDKERVLPAWDALISRQQAALDKLGVPSLFVSKEKGDRERQQRVVQVLEGIVSGDK